MGMMDFVSPSPIFELHLPCLRSLSLTSFTEIDSVQAMVFFERHPSIEYLDLPGNQCWFSSHQHRNLLPNLRHLGVRQICACCRIIIDNTPRRIGMTFGSLHQSSASCPPFLSTTASMHRYLTFSGTFLQMDFLNSEVWILAKHRHRVLRTKILRGVFGSKMTMVRSKKPRQRSNQGPCSISSCILLSVQHQT